MVDDSVIDKQKHCYMNNIKLKKAGVDLLYTKEQVDEFLKCKSDIIYFIETYVKIISLDHGLVNFELYPYQEEMINTYSSNRFSINLLPRQSGKCVSRDTNITVKNNKTNEIETITIGDFYDRCRA